MSIVYAAHEIELFKRRFHQWAYNMNVTVNSESTTTMLESIISMHATERAERLKTQQKLEKMESENRSLREQTESMFVVIQKTNQELDRLQKLIGRPD